MGAVRDLWLLARDRGVRRYVFSDLPMEPYVTHHVWTERLNRIWCRIRGHRAGVVWFNVNGYEPDMTCRGCGEDLG